MEIEFQMVDDKHIKIIGIDRKQDGTTEKHEIGEIFTPGGSGESNMNAIQVCGFSEAFELWGCSTYAKPSSPKVVMTDVQEQMRDIQLKFDLEVIRRDWKYNEKTCHKCYNEPCTCEIFVRKENPFTVKCSQDLYLEKKPEEKK